MSNRALPQARTPAGERRLFSPAVRSTSALSIRHSEMSGVTMAEKKERPRKIVADNRKARFNYEIGEVVEAGIALTGTEVKSLRNGRAAIAESYADAKNGEIWLINANIPEYLQASRFNHAPKRPRKLLLHKRQIRKLAAAVEREGMTIVPLRLFFNEKGRAKIDIALGRGKKLHDKRETEKKRSWDRERGRLMRVKG
jgi:SsrA-binding protein